MILPTHLICNTTTRRFTCGHLVGGRGSFLLLLHSKAHAHRDGRQSPARHLCLQEDRYIVSLGVGGWLGSIVLGGTKCKSTGFGSGVALICLATQKGRPRLVRWPAAVKVRVQGSLHPTATGHATGKRASLHDNVRASTQREERLQGAGYLDQKCVWEQNVSLRVNELGVSSCPDIARRSCSHHIRLKRKKINKKTKHT